MGNDGGLSISLAGRNQSLLLAERQLRQAWANCYGRPRRGTESAGSQEPSVSLIPGSLLSGAVIVRYEQPFHGEAAREAAPRGLTAIAWDQPGEFEVWRELGRPLSRLPHRGEPDFSRPWMVTLASERIASKKSEPPRHDEQLHVIGTAKVPLQHRHRTDAVWWPNLPTVAAAVVGRCESVLGDSDALAWDALRLGVPVINASLNNQRADSTRAPSLLAGLVPATLLADRQLWRHVAQTIARLHREGGTPVPLLTPEWIARGRQLAEKEYSPVAVASLERSKRLITKWRRDPERFCADSRHAVLRRLGRWLHSQ